ncbi:hypothetical protein ACHAQA_010079 [Verticillium albo-atrum]
MKLLLAVVIALMACTDLASAWRMRLYKGEKFTGASSTIAGKGRPGKGCHRVSSFKGPNLSKRFKSNQYWPYDPTYKTSCGVYFYYSKNCKGERGSGYLGGGGGSFGGSGTSYERYQSIDTTCKYADRKRSEIEGDDGDSNATAAALEAIDKEYLTDLEYTEDLEARDEWDISELVGWDEAEGGEE